MAVSFCVRFFPGKCEIIKNKTQIDELNNIKIKLNDVIGIGIVYHKSYVFVTLNGEKIGKYYLSFDSCNFTNASNFNTSTNINDIICE